MLFCFCQSSYNLEIRQLIPAFEIAKQEKYTVCGKVYLKVLLTIFITGPKSFIIPAKLVTSAVLDSNSSYLIS